MKRRLWSCILIIAMLVTLLPVSVFATTGAETNNYFVFDHRVIQQAENAELKVNEVTKDTSNNPLLTWTRTNSWTENNEEGVPEWEQRTNLLYPYVIYDEDYGDTGKWRMWYIANYVGDTMSGKIYKADNTTTAVSGNHILCYQESNDGITWTRPDCGEYKWKTSDNELIGTNILYIGLNGVGIYKNENINAPADKKYILAVGTPSAIYIAFSPDGLSWSSVQKVKDNLYVDGNYLWDWNMSADTTNNVFWSQELGKYVYVTRGFNPNRTVVCLYSDDLATWSDPIEVLNGPADAQPYSVRTVRYCDGYYIGIASIYCPTAGNTDIPFDTNPNARKVWAELVWSPDAVNWYYVNQGDAFIPNGTTLVQETVEGYDRPQIDYEQSDIDYGTIYPSAMQVVDGEIVVYYQCSTDIHTDISETRITNYDPGYYKPNMARATLALDKFSAYQQTSSAYGYVTTNAIKVTGGVLNAVAEVEPDGSISAAIADINGNIINGYEYVAGTDADGDRTYSFAWANGLNSLEGEDVCLKFRLDNAKMYTLNGTIELANVITVGFKEDSMDIDYGTSHSLPIKIEPATEYDISDMTFTSSDPDVVTVDENGVVTGITSGTATITMETDDGLYTDSIVVICHGNFSSSFESDFIADGWDAEWGTTHFGTRDANARTGDCGFGFEAGTGLCGVKKSFNTSQDKVLTVWFYDDGAATVPHRALARVDGNGKYVGLGVQTGVNDHYYIWSTGTVTTEATVARSEGWHRFTFDAATPETGIDLYVDEVKVGSVAEINAFSILYIAYWDNITASNYCWDDVAVTDALPFTPNFNSSFENDFIAEGWDAVWGTTHFGTRDANARTGDCGFGFEAGTGLCGVKKSFDTAQDKVLTVWFYDDGAATVPHRALARVDGNGKYVGLGVQTGVNDSYYIWSTGTVTTEATVARSEGWHCFTFDAATPETGIDLYVDEVKVGSVAEIDAFSILYIAYWDSSTTASTYCWDDVAVADELN